MAMVNTVTMTEEKAFDYAKMFLDFVNPDRWDGEGKMPESVRPERDFCVTFGDGADYMLLWLEEDSFGWWAVCKAEGFYTQNATQDIGSAESIVGIIAETIGI